MWVWSDDLIGRLSGRGAHESGGVPLVAYAVPPDADLDELARTVLGDAAVEEPRAGAIAAVDSAR